MEPLYKSQQEVFDVVATHLMTQKQQCVTESWSCRYRHTNGLKCAIGALIPDELYNFNLEERNVDSIISDDGFNFYPDQDTVFLTKLQSVHDTYTKPTKWFTELDRLAQSFGLDASVLYKEAKKNKVRRIKYKSLS